MNTYDLTQELLNRNGEVSTAKIPKITMVKGDDGEMHEEKRLEDKVVTLGSMLEHVCLKEDGVAEEAPIVQRYELYLKLKDALEVDLSAKEVELLKKLVSQAFDVYFAGTILALLNNK